MGEENVSPSLTPGKLTSIAANVVCTDWEKMGKNYEPGSNFYYTNSWGMHICSLYLVLSNQHMLLRYGLKYVCVSLLLGENKISTTVFWETRADNFCRERQKNVIIIIIITTGNKFSTISCHRWLCCMIVFLCCPHIWSCWPHKKPNSSFVKTVTHNNPSLSNFYFHLRRHEHQDIKKWQNIKIF